MKPQKPFDKAFLAQIKTPEGLRDYCEFIIQYAPLVKAEAINNNLRELCERVTEMRAACCAVGKNNATKFATLENNLLKMICAELQRMIKKDDGEAVLKYLKQYCLLRWASVEKHKTFENDPALQKMIEAACASGRTAKSISNGVLLLIGQELNFSESAVYKAKASL